MPGTVGTSIPAVAERILQPVIYVPKWPVPGTQRHCKTDDKQPGRNKHKHTFVPGRGSDESSKLGSVRLCYTDNGKVAQ